MGFQARKSFKVMPGVRMTVSKGGVSTSVGVRGARISRSTSGRTTRTVGIPGTGLYHTKSSSSGTSDQRSAPSRSTSAPVSAPAAPPKPGMFAPKWEKELYRALSTGNFDELPRIAEAYPEAAPIAATIDGLHAMAEGDHSRALGVCRWAWSTAGDIATDPFVQKYLAATSASIPIATGVTATLPLGRDALGLCLAELEQDAGNISGAIAVVEQLDPSVIAGVSLSELYILAGRNDDVLELTNGISNDDDATALLITFRGVACRELGHLIAAREAFKEALKSKSRDSGIRHRALVERARTYLAESKPAMARKDLERVLAEDASVPGVRKMLDELS
jgi:hypothetical protein